MIFRCITVLFSFGLLNCNANLSHNQEFSSFQKELRSFKQYHEQVIEEHRVMEQEHTLLKQKISGEKQNDQAQKIVLNHNALAKSHQKILHHHVQKIADHDLFIEEVISGKLKDKSILREAVQRFLEEQRTMKKECEQLKADYARMKIDHGKLDEYLQQLAVDSGSDIDITNNKTTNGL